MLTDGTHHREAKARLEPSDSGSQPVDPLLQGQARREQTSSVFAKQRDLIPPRSTTQSLPPAERKPVTEVSKRVLEEYRNLSPEEKEVR